MDDGNTPGNVPDRSDHLRVYFETADVAGQDAFVEDYVLDAARRLPETDACDEFIFIRAGHDPNADGGLIVVDAYGDVDAILDAERETWEGLIEDGPLTDWTRPDHEVVGKLVEAFGEAGWWHGERLRSLASRMTAATWDELDEPPAPADAYPDEGGEPVGWYRVLHLLSNQWGYDVDAEMDAYTQALRMGTTIIGKNRGMDAAESFVADVEAELQGALDELEASGEAGEGVPEMDDDAED